MMDHQSVPYFLQRADNTTTLSWNHVPALLSAAIPYFLMAYLTRRSGTHIYRLLLLPFAVIIYVRCTTQHPVGDVYGKWFDWIRGGWLGYNIAQQLTSLQA